MIRAKETCRCNLTAYQVPVGQQEHPEAAVEPLGTEHVRSRIGSFCDRMLGDPWRTGTSRFKKASGHRSEKQKDRDIGKGSTFPKVRSELMAPEERTGAVCQRPPS